MVSVPCLLNAYNLSRLIDKKNLKGAIVECGVWKGGCVGLMGKASNSRPIWLFDSFEGLPEPIEMDGERAIEYANQQKQGNLQSIGKCVGRIDEVKELLFSKLKIEKERVHFIQGWFQHTLAREKRNVGSIALLRLDGDWYESTKVCLDELYDQVVEGGYIIIDDYFCWEGCKKAVDEFFMTRNLNIHLIQIDDFGIYFIKK